jgi:hypothetical protein
MIGPMSRTRMSKTIAATAPITSDDPARIPQPKAAATAIASRGARGARNRRLVRRQRSGRRVADVGERRADAVRRGLLVREGGEPVCTARHPAPCPSPGRAERPLPHGVAAEGISRAVGGVQIARRGRGPPAAAVGLLPLSGRTEHVFVGAGDGPCAILMAGARWGDWNVRYRVSELAARYGASVQEESNSPREAYTSMGFAPSRRERPSYWGRLPWA